MRLVLALVNSYIATLARMNIVAYNGKQTEW